MNKLQSFLEQAALNGVTEFQLSVTTADESNYPESTGFILSASESTAEFIVNNNGIQQISSTFGWPEIAEDTQEIGAETGCCGQDGKAEKAA